MKHPVVGLLLALVCAGCGASDTGPATNTGPVTPIQPIDAARVRFVIPEVYELANVIIALTDFGVAQPNAVNKNTDYYSRVFAAFGPYRDISAMRQLQIDDWELQLYQFRENSFPYFFDGTLIKQRSEYGMYRSWSPNLFRDRLSAVQQFADVSQFRAFYHENQAYYEDAITRHRSILELESQAAWLERELAPGRFDLYTVVFSPLIGGSHSANVVQGPQGSEALMFVCGPDRATAASDSAGVAKAKLQRVVFTEIDHLFVNPVTDRYQKDVQRAFVTRSQWTTDPSIAFYPSVIGVFNEYMTWAVFTLYLDDLQREGRVTAWDFAEVVRVTEQQMEQGRRFQRFRSFDQELLRLYRTRAPGQRVSDLYPAIIEWAGRQ